MKVLTLDDMKTNEVMKRPMGQFEVLQRTSDRYFDLNTLLYSIAKIKKNDVRGVSEIFRNERTQNYVSFLSKRGIKAYDVIKGYNTANGRTRDEVWVHPQLLLEILRFADLEAYVLVKNELIKSGDIVSEVVAEYNRPENIFLSVLDKTIKYSSAFKCELQYSCCDNKYRTDAMLIDEHDSFKEFIIVEYDEKQHNTLTNIRYDSDREREITKFLFEKYFDLDTDFYIYIVRVTPETEAVFYTYALPYLTGIDTSFCKDEMTNRLDFRTLFAWDGCGNYKDKYGLLNYEKMYNDKYQKF